MCLLVCVRLLSMSGSVSAIASPAMIRFVEAYLPLILEGISIETVLIAQNHRLEGVIHWRLTEPSSKSFYWAFLLHGDQQSIQIANPEWFLDLTDKVPETEFQQPFHLQLPGYLAPGEIQVSIVASRTLTASGSVAKSDLQTVPLPAIMVSPADFPSPLDDSVIREVFPEPALRLSRAATLSRISRIEVPVKDPIPRRHLGMISALEKSRLILQSTQVGELTVTFSDGDRQIFPLKAGIQVAEGFLEPLSSPLQPKHVRIFPLKSYRPFTSPYPQPAQIYHTVFRLRRNNGITAVSLVYDHFRGVLHLYDLVFF